MRAFLALGLAAFAVAGCGASAPGPADTTAGARVPAGPPPDPGMRGAPPPAWVETKRGRVWLGYATFCWAGGCADSVPPACGDRHVPDVIVDRGERVRFHLGFDPREPALAFFSRDGVDTSKPHLFPADADRTFEWTATREGPAWLSANAERGGDAAYSACVRLARDELTVEEALARGSGDVAVRGTLYVEGEEMWLCDALAESYPPQCPGARLAVRGADGLETRLVREGEIAWGEEPTTLRGTLDGPTLVVAP